MGKIIIQNRTTKDPITLIGEEAGICWGADTSDPVKNYKRGMDCINNQHGRTWEFPDVYMTIDGYSARVIRELYTHIGGAPTRLQASTRYINYTKDDGFEYVVPHSIESNAEADRLYTDVMEIINRACFTLENEYGIKREDAAMLLPLGMSTKMVGKYNLRTLADMSEQRECTRAYWEFRELFKDLKKALSEYSEEWATLVDILFKPKCEKLGYCPEKKPCARSLKFNT